MSGSGKRVIRWLRQGLIGAFCLWLVLILMGRGLRYIAIGEITELTNAKIESKSVDLNLNGSVFIKKLVVKPHKERKHDNTILKAETVYARFSVGSILLLRPRLKEIIVDNFVFDAQYDLDMGRWNIGALKIKVPKGGVGKMPVVRLEKGTLKYSKVSNGEVKTAAVVPVDARFGPAEKMGDGYSFTITTAERAELGKSILSGLWKPGSVIITGGISSADVPAFERAWAINALAAELDYDQDNTYTLKLGIKDFLSKQKSGDKTITFEGPEFLEGWSPFTALQKFFNRYKPRGRVDIELDASGNLRQLGESILRGKVFCKNISIWDRKFPYPIEHIVGWIDFTEKSVVLNNLSGEHGDVKLTFNGWTKGFGQERQYEIQVASDNMSLDDDLYDALSARQKKSWSAFSPSGLAAIDYRMVKQLQTDKERTLAVELLGTEAMYRHFPYPLKNLTGRLLFDRDGITFSDVVSQFNGCRIAINGKAASLGTDRPTYEFGIKAEDVPLDSTLAASLSDKQRTFYNQLNIAGLADAEVKVSTPEDAGSINVTSNISLKEVFLNPDYFPLAVSGVFAKTVITRDLIHIENLTGRCGQGTISLAGRIWPGAESEQPYYHLLLQAEQAELNDDLFGLLPESLKKIAGELQPEGKINYSVDLDKSADTDYPDYRITIDCLGNIVNSKSVPYPVKDITGKVKITKDNIELEDITGIAADNIQIAPNRQTLKINGEIVLADNAFSSAELQLDANDIFFDEQVGVALPKSIQPLYLKLSPTGRFGLRLEDIKIFDAGDGEKYIDFAGGIKFKGCNFNISPSVTELNAMLKTKGLYKTNSGFCEGEAILFANGLKIKGKSLTSLKADIFYDSSRQSWLTKNLIADCYGGRLTGKFELKCLSETTLEYLLRIGFDNIDLRRFLSDTKPKETSKNGPTSGKMNGSLSVTGQIVGVAKRAAAKRGSNTGHLEVPGDNYLRVGRCKLTITDMEVGKLSPLAKLLYVLKLTEPKDFAFDSMLVDSYIRHNRLFFEYLDLSGEAVAFTGSGWMDLQNQDVDLVLFARGARLAVAEPSILQSLTEGLGHAVVRIEVTGNFYDPKITTKTLPVIKETLGILGTRPIAPNP